MTNTGRIKTWIFTVLVAASCFSCLNQDSSVTPVAEASPAVSPTVADSATPVPQASPEERTEVSETPSEGIIPGQIIDTQGKPLAENISLNFLILETEHGQAVIGCWNSLQPDFYNSVFTKNHGVYEGATVTFVGDDFIKVVPAGTIPATTRPANPVKPLPGLAYINKNGTFLISLSDAKIPAGYEALGQASIKHDVLQRWKQNKSNLKIKRATDLRS